MKWFYSKNIVTQKAQSLYQIALLTECIPPTFMYSSYDDLFIERVLDYLDCNTQHSVFYIRFCFSDILYPHYLGKLSSKTDIIVTIEELLEEIQKRKITAYDIIIQPLLSLAYSGSIFVNAHNDMLIETVMGAAPLLFRNGLVNNRIFIRNNEIVTHEHFTQDYKLCWDSINRQWVKQTINFQDSSIDIDQFKKLHLQCHMMYEFGVTEEQDIFLFESKAIPAVAFSSLNCEKSSNSYFEIYPANDCFPFLEVSSPMFGNIDSIVPNTNYIIKKGAYTSHFATYLITNNIGCYFVR